MRQRGRDSWQLRVYLGTDPETGRQRWASRTVHGSQRFAQAQLRELTQEAGYAHLRAGTLADLLDRWFEAASPGWALTTVSHTRSVIDCYLKPHLGHLHVTKLTTEDIDDFYGHLLRAGGGRGQPLAPGTVARVHGVLHRALAQAVRWEWIWLNPASNASPPRVPPAEIRPPSPKQVVKLLEAVRTEDPALFSFLRLAASTGARRGQLLALRWHAIDWEAGAVAFTRALVQGPRGPELRPTKTHRTHRADLDRGTLAALASHRARVEAQAAEHGVELAEVAFVFSSQPDGSRPWQPNWVTKRFITHRRAAGLETFRLHDLRHFMATQMLAGGVPIATVSQRLNHARASTTLNVYAHAVPGGDRQAAEMLAALLDGEPRRHAPAAHRHHESSDTDVTVPVVEPVVSEEKLRQLLDEQHESQTLDHRATCDLTHSRSSGSTASARGCVPRSCTSVPLPPSAPPSRRSMRSSRRKGTRAAASTTRSTSATLAGARRSACGPSSASRSERRAEGHGGADGNRAGYDRRRPAARPRGRAVTVAWTV